jgi:hypothetical protein
MKLHHKCCSILSSIRNPNFITISATPSSSIRNCIEISPTLHTKKNKQAFFPSFAYKVTPPWALIGPTTPHLLTTWMKISKPTHFVAWMKRGQFSILTRDGLCSVGSKPVRACRLLPGVVVAKTLGIIHGKLACLSPSIKYELLFIPPVQHLKLGGIECTTATKICAFVFKI